MSLKDAASESRRRRGWGEEGEEKDQYQGLPSRYKHRVPYATTDIYE